MYTVSVLGVALLPSVMYAFDYGPVGNGVFWAVLVLWSMFAAYVLLVKREALWGGIGAFATALLSPGVRPKKVPRNPHIVADHPAHMPAHVTTDHRTHVVGTAGKPDIGAVALATSHYARATHPMGMPNTHVPPAHTIPTHHTPALQTSTQKTVVHSTHMSAAPTHHTTAPVPTLTPTPAHAPAAVSAAPAASQAPTTVHTKDTLTLEIVAGVPKLILKREKK